MARITVEDCLKNIPNRFQLALAATYRARQLAQGHTPKIESRDKPTVTFPPPMDPDIVTHELTIQVPMVGNPLLPPGARWPPARGQ